MKNNQKNNGNESGKGKSSSPSNNNGNGRQRRNRKRERQEDIETTVLVVLTSVDMSENTDNDSANAGLTEEQKKNNEYSLLKAKEDGNNKEETAFCSKCGTAVPPGKYCMCCGAPISPTGGGSPIPPAGGGSTPPPAGGGSGSPIHFGGGGASAGTVAGGRGWNWLWYVLAAIVLLAWIFLFLRSCDNEKLAVIPPIVECVDDEYFGAHERTGKLFVNGYTIVSAMVDDVVGATKDKPNHVMYVEDLTQLKGLDVVRQQTFPKRLDEKNWEFTSRFEISHKGDCRLINVTQSFRAKCNADIEDYDIPACEYHVYGNKLNKWEVAALPLIQDETSSLRYKKAIVTFVFVSNATYYSEPVTIEFRQYATKSNGYVAQRQTSRPVYVPSPVNNEPQSDVISSSQQEIRGGTSNSDKGSDGSTVAVAGKDSDCGCRGTSSSHSCVKKVEVTTKVKIE